ncbi:MAG: PSD1 and planctomycete cytochrome C domain-containing protein [Planctomycetaceae bacterium]
MMQRRCSIGAYVWLIVVAGTVSGDDDAFFREAVEPILRHHCYECHAHSSGNMEGGLTLDWRSGWKTGGDRGPAIVPGDPAASLLIRAISHSDPDLQMPEEKLAQHDIDVLTQWVKRGAPDPRTAKPEAALDPTDWWSLQPLVRPKVPVVSGANPIDAFLRAKLAEQNLVRSDHADRRTLLRRLTFDLHGLPPTSEELAAFEADTDPAAWEHLIDRLLASPRYGERWARHWLDTVHFADSHGFEHDVFRPHAWRYRDYVIDSFNRDTPWGTFIREQLAADVFYPDSPQLTAALGFLGAGPYDQSAAATAPMSFEYLDRDDLVTQTMGAFVSTTANCARCHAHKFDPIPQADYFALQAVFAGIGKGDISYDADPAIAQQRPRWQNLIAAATAGNAEVLLAEENQKLLAAWEADRPAQAVWKPLQLLTFVSTGGADLRKRADGSVLSAGTRPDKETTVVTVTTELSEITAFRLDVLTDESLPVMGPGRADNGNLHLSEFEVSVFRPAQDAAETVRIRRATADFDQTNWTIQHALDGNPATAWGIHPQVGQSHHAVFELETPLPVDADTQFAITLKQVHGGSHIIGRFRLSATDGPPATAIALAAETAAVLDIPPESRSREQQLQLSGAVLKHLAQQQLSQLPAQVQVYAAAAAAKNERGMVTFSKPRPIHLLTRGDLEKPRDEVAPGTLSALAHLSARFSLPAGHSENARRTALADWIADSQNPLTWRSIANRVWHYHFGRGVCDTPNDFGRMGSLPTHPQLLDWMACELRDKNGSLKHLHRLICTSETYQQTSHGNSGVQTPDPDNRWLARMSRRRLDADSYRDAVLAVAGQLDLTMGGPGISHFTTSPGPQVTPVLHYDAFDLDSAGAGRRSIYRVVWRGIADPFLDALDFPDLGLLAPTRGFSASPLQSLVLLNNRFVLHHCRHMADRARKETDDLQQQIGQTVMRTWLRIPTDEERNMFHSLAEKHGLEAVCRLLLNSNEFLFVD